MKVSALRTLVVVTMPLIHTGSVTAGFAGVSTVSKPNPFGLLTVNVYAEFDRPGEDHMLAVGGTPNVPLMIEVIGGTFYQNPVGSDRPPNCALGCPFPSVAFDTFVTIGVKAVDVGHQPEDAMFMSPGWPGFQPDTLLLTDSGWMVTADDAQGDPFNSDFVAGDGRVLLGQFSTLDGSAIQGTIMLQYISNNVDGQSVISFFHVPAPGAFVLLGAMGVLGGRRRSASC